MSEPRMLSREQQGACWNYLETRARPLELARARCTFDGAGADEYLEALAGFANDDGGFGHGLEPDLPGAPSSPFQTSVAFQHLRRAGAAADHPLVVGAMRYLAGSYDAEARTWPPVPVAAQQAAGHAPWWSGAEDLERGRINPRAELVGYLVQYREAAADLPVDALLEDLRGHLEARRAEGPVEMHEMLCLRRLAASPGLPGEWKAPLRKAVDEACERWVQKTPEAWGGYGLTPIEGAPEPKVDPCSGEDYRADAYGVPAYLDHLIETLDPSGSWPLAWSWAEVDEEGWAAAELAWRGVRICDHLEVLSAYGRLEE